MSTLLLRGGTIHGGGPGGATALAAIDGRVAFVGDDDAAAAYDGADQVIDLHGALVAPAFVDAHVHSVLTGFGLTRLDLHRATTLTEALDLVAEQAAVQPDGVVVGTGWEEHAWPEGRPPTQDELERAAPGRMVLFERRDCHSSVISASLAAAVDNLASYPGYDSGGRVERDARQAVTKPSGS